MARVKVGPDSSLYWLPPIQKALPVPKTRTAVVSKNFGWDYMADAEHEPKAHARFESEVADLMAEIRKAADELGYPVFLRTDLGSGKHSGPVAYRLDSEADIDRAIAETMEDNMLKDLFPRAFLIRKWLDLDVLFRAFHGHGIAHEWRFFVSARKVWCRHFYWPEEAIRFWKGDTELPDWRERLRAAATSAPMDSENLGRLSRVAVERIAEAREGAPKTWSVDWARDKDGRWWLIDMAVAGHSWHPEECDVFRANPDVFADDRGG